VTSISDGKSRYHCAFNYWMQPPTQRNFLQPYEDSFWEEQWQEIAYVLHNMQEEAWGGKKEEKKEKVKEKKGEKKAVKETQSASLAANAFKMSEMHEHSEDEVKEKKGGGKKAPVKEVKKGGGKEAPAKQEKRGGGKEVPMKKEEKKPQQGSAPPKKPQQQNPNNKNIAKPHHKQQGMPKTNPNANTNAKRKGNDDSADTRPQKKQKK